jgi:hypothetical protein
MNHWRTLLARAPLPMLALAASYGVYSFALLFVPFWVAIIQAAAFELTYIGLSVTQGLSAGQRKRASGIASGAVVASIVYNTLAGWFHRQPDLLSAASPIAWLMFAILHGAPLAWVAYLVADLLLHSGSADQRSEGAQERSVETIAPDVAENVPALPGAALSDPTIEALSTPAVIALDRYPCPHCSAPLSSGRAVGAAKTNGYCQHCKALRLQSA